MGGCQSSEAPQRPASVFSRSPQAWRAFLTIGASHTILAVGANLAPRLLPHLRTSFLHEGRHDWASTYTFVILWSLIGLLYYQALRWLSRHPPLALRWTLAWGGFLVTASLLTLTLPPVADVPFVSNLCLALAMTLFVQSALEAGFARERRP